MNRAFPPLALALLGLAGCFAPTSSTQKLADSAYDMNLASRFGRMDVAMEHIGQKSREDYTKKHAGWGKTARIVDIDFAGLNVKKSGEGEVVVTISWQRPDETTMRVTSLVQTWIEGHGAWYWASEEAKGDPGLIEEDAKPGDKQNAKMESGEAPAKPVAPERPRYQTRVIYESSEE